MSAWKQARAHAIWIAACVGVAFVAWRAGLDLQVVRERWAGQGPTALMGCCLGIAAGVLIGGFFWMAWFENRDAVLRLANSLALQPGDVHRAPLAEVGPTVVVLLLRAINARAARDAECAAAQLQAQAQCAQEMRGRLVRVGLHCEALRDAVLRARIERDLMELDALVHASLVSVRAGHARPESGGAHEVVVEAMPSLSCAA